MLDKDADEAQAAAIHLRRHLLSIAPARQNNFENSLTTNDTYMSNLNAFSTVRPAVRLWHGHRAYKPLFKFVALRFLLAPDEVLDCERTHARWQWLCCNAHCT